MAKHKKHREKRAETPPQDHVDPADLRDDTPKKPRRDVLHQHRAQSALSSVKRPKKAGASQTKTVALKAPKKKESRKTPTSVAISPADKQALADTGRAMFVSMPRDVQPRSPKQTNALVALIAASKAKIGLEKVITSGHSYIAVLYRTTQMRDTAVAALQGEKVEWKGRALAPLVAPFGVRTNSEQPQAWIIPVGPMDTPTMVGDALAATFRQQQWQMVAYSIRVLRRDNLDLAVFVVSLPGHYF